MAIDGNVQPAIELQHIQNPISGGGGGGGNLLPTVANTVDDVLQAGWQAIDDLLLGGGKGASATVPTVTVPPNVPTGPSSAWMGANSAWMAPGTSSTWMPMGSNSAWMPMGSNTLWHAPLSLWDKASLFLMNKIPWAVGTAATLPATTYISDAIYESMSGNNFQPNTNLTSTPTPTPVVDPNSDLAQSAVDPNLGVAAQSQQLMDYLNMINSEIDLQEQGVLAGQQARYGDLLYQQALARGMSDPSGLTGGMAEQYSDKLSAAEIAAFGQLDLQTEQMLRDLEMMRLNAPMQAEQMVMEDWQNLAEQIGFATQMAQFYEEQAAYAIDEETRNNFLALAQPYYSQIQQLSAQQSGLQGFNQFQQPQKPQLPETFTGFGTLEQSEFAFFSEAGVTAEGLQLYKNTAAQLEQLVANSTPGFGEISQEELVQDAQMMQMLTRLYENDTVGDVSVWMPFIGEDKRTIDLMKAEGILEEEDITFDAERATQNSLIWGGGGLTAGALLPAMVSFLLSFIPGLKNFSGFFQSAVVPLAAAGGTAGAVGGAMQYKIPREVVEEILTDTTLKYQNEQAKLGLGG